MSDQSVSEAGSSGLRPAERYGLTVYDLEIASRRKIALATLDRK